MSEEFETVEIDMSDENILYYLYDEDDEEIGFVVEEDGEEVEYYYEWVDSEAYTDLEGTLVDDGDPGTTGDAEAGQPGAVEDFYFDDDEEETDENETADVDEVTDADADEGAETVDLADLDGEVVELEIDEDDIDHYLFDEEGNEIGFVIIEDGAEVECYYQDDEEDVEPAEEPAASKAPAEPEEPKEHGYLYKMTRIAGYEGGKARDKASNQLNKAREKAAPKINEARSKAEAGIDKATEKIEATNEKMQEKSDESTLGITREGVAEATADLNAIAKEGAATAKELKEAYDDIMDSFGFLVPKNVRRKLP